MSEKLFQNAINQMKGALSVTVGVVDDRGVIVASSDISQIGINMDQFSADAVPEEADGTFVLGDRTFKLIDNESTSFEYAAFVEGTGASAESLCSIVSVTFKEAKINYDAKHNKAAFVKNIISDNILPGDVYVRAKELHFVTDDPRSCILVRQKDTNEIAAVEVIQRLFPDRQNDFVLSINEKDVVVIKLLKTKDEREEVLKTAKLIEKTLSEELGIECVIGISTVARHLRELADRYKESQVAIDVGSIFDAESSIIRYDSLGLGRIIYQLPTTLCEMFLNEVFKRNPIEALDDDTLDTINKFFENNLNVSETSRKLYVHRNTLVYRLEKIKKVTGLDLREFDHAIVFKVAMMVRMYLDSLNLGTGRY